jgi:hypothetical protein
VVHQPYGPRESASKNALRTNLYGFFAAILIATPNV